MDRPFHPLLFAVYPVVAILAWNLGETQPGDGLRALVLSLAGAAAVWWLSSRILRSGAKGALLTSLIWVLLFSYGHVYDELKTASLAGVTLGRHRLLLAVWAAVLIGAAVWIVRARAVSLALTRFLNVTVSVAVLLPLIQLGAAGVNRLTSPATQTAPPIRLSPPSDQPPPDVYYIILDAYTRQDVLSEVFNYDNQPFIQRLEDLGFVVTSQSRSNYAITKLSLPSSLNMNYLDALGPPLDPNATDSAWLDEICRSNALRLSLESIGYTTVAFESAYGMTDWKNADIYLSPRPTSLSDARAFGGLNPLEALLVDTSIGRVIIDGRVKLNALIGTNLPDPNKEFRDRILFAFDRLGKVPEISGPKFVWVHIMSPHPPYIFTADGGIASQTAVFTLADQVSPVGIPGERQAYADQVNYINTRTLEAVKEILANSKTPPIIVIQGDHGAFHVTPEDRMKNLNAYYLPGGGSPQVYDSISPVNTFRVILNRYFGANLPLLPDRHYYSEFSRPFELTPIP
jgi:hypothetical protein